MSEKGTEQATPQRKNKAKEKGDRVRSRELLSAAGMLGGLLMFGSTAKGLSASWGDVYQKSIHLVAISDAVGEQPWVDVIRQIIAPSLVPVGVVLATSFVCVLFVGMVQSGGVQIHGNALEPKFSRINPAENAKSLLSLKSLMRLVKSLVPAAIMAVLGWKALKGLMLPLPVLSVVRLPGMISAAYELAVDAGWIMLAWSALDYAIEWRSWNERLKMTKQEIREEIKEAMGNPEVKGKIRQIQRAMRKRKVKADMSRASVVITNPTHYAVALEFSLETMQAPMVLAKGRDLFAAEIREEARWAGVPIIENPPLARSLYRMVEVGQAIPFDLYSAVAGILAFLYQQKMKERTRREQQAQQMREYPVLAAGMRGVGGGM